MTYQERIKQIAPAADPRLVEAWMRDMCGTLDHLSAQAFREEICIALDCIEQAPDLSEQLAESYGL